MPDSQEFREPRSPVWVIVGIAALAAAGVAGSWAYEEFREPSLSEMRAHVLSKMSDADIRRVKAEADVELVRREQAIRDDAKRSSQEAAERRVKCDDIAYRTRYPSSCLTGFITEPFRQNTVEIFEQRLMGMCNFARSVREARAFGCLP